MLDDVPLTHDALANLVLHQRRRKTMLTLQPVVQGEGSTYIKCTVSGPGGTSVLVEDESVSYESATIADYEAMFELVAVVRCPNCAFKFLIVPDATGIPPLCLECESEGYQQLWNGKIVQE